MIIMICTYNSALPQAKSMTTSLNIQVCTQTIKNLSMCARIHIHIHAFCGRWYSITGNLHWLCLPCASAQQRDTICRPGGCLFGAAWLQLERNPLCHSSGGTHIVLEELSWSVQEVMRSQGDVTKSFRGEEKGGEEALSVSVCFSREISPCSPRCDRCDNQVRTVFST